jgi:hypothetical protein
MAKIRDVEPKNGYHLLIELDTGRIIYLSMSDKVETVRFHDLKNEANFNQVETFRFHDLKNEAIFNQVETDGYALYWDFGRISISLSEIYEMTSVKRDFIPEQKKSVI